MNTTKQYTLDRMGITNAAVVDIGSMRHAACISYPHCSTLIIVPQITARAGSGAVMRP